MTDYYWSSAYHLLVTRKEVPSIIQLANVCIGNTVLQTVTIRLFEEQYYGLNPNETAPS